MLNRSIEFESEREFHRLYCENPEYLLAIENSLGIKVVARGNVLHIEGSDNGVADCEKLFSLLVDANRQGFSNGKYDF